MLLILFLFQILTFELDNQVTVKKVWDYFDSIKIQGVLDFMAINYFISQMKEAKLSKIASPTCALPFKIIKGCLSYPFNYLKLPFGKMKVALLLAHYF